MENLIKHPKVSKYYANDFGSFLRGPLHIVWFSEIMLTLSSVLQMTFVLINFHLILMKALKKCEQFIL